jgi:tRNA splicing ligase
VFYQNLWDTHPLLRECRGLVVDADYNIVARPFTKIFNYKENNAGLNWKDTDLVLITKKVNGFMASVTRFNDQLLISTTGSLDSDFVDFANEYLKDINPNFLKRGHTYMFEVCHPKDPHIIPENYGAHFLAAVCHVTGYTLYKFDAVDMIDEVIDYFPTVGVHIDGDDDIPSALPFGQLKTFVKECRHEGFVIVNEEETIKIKSPWYLANKAIARKEDIFKLNKTFIDEEYFELIDHLKSLDSWESMEEQVRLQYIRNYFESM